MQLYHLAVCFQHAPLQRHPRDLLVVPPQLGRQTHASHIVSIQDLAVFIQTAVFAHHPQRPALERHLIAYLVSLAALEQVVQEIRFPVPQGFSAHPVVFFIHPHFVVADLLLMQRLSLGQTEIELRLPGVQLREQGSVEMARQPFEEFPVRLQILDNGIADRFFPANLEHTAGLRILPQHALYHLRISHPGILERPGFLHQIQLTGVGATIG